VGLGIPIPLINERVASSAALKDEEIYTNILDYGIPSRNRPVLKKTSYAELKSGRVEINGVEVTTSPLSSYKIAKEIAEKLKEWIKEKRMYLSRPAELLPRDTVFKPLQIRRRNEK
jgi:uncharacterized protein (DUF39 family)